MTRTEKAAAANIGPVPATFVHTPLPGKPEPPDISALPDIEQKTINIWIAGVDAGFAPGLLTDAPKQKADGTGDLSVAAIAAIHAHVIYFASADYLAWHRSDFLLHREAQYRLGFVDAIEHAHSLGTSVSALIPISS